MKKPLWVVRLPKNAEILAKKGDKVIVGQKLAKLPRGHFLFSPVNGRVILAKNRELEIEFSAKVVVGKGFGKKSVWGEPLVVDQPPYFLELNFGAKKRLVLTPAVDGIFSTKAEALGVGGIVCFQLASQEVGTPLLLVKKTDWQKLVVDAQKSVGLKWLLAPHLDCLFVVNK